MTDNYSTIIDDYSSQIEKNLVKIIERRSGITFDSAKRAELKHDIRLLMEEKRFNSFQTYYNYLLEGKESESEIKKIINLVTVNETFFFRVEDHFTILKEVVIPEIIKDGKKKIRIWCAGCSSGEEVYSIAITLMDLKINIDEEFDFEVIGTDINSDVLKIAKDGVYEGRTLNLVSDDILKNYFDEKHNGYIVKKVIREKTNFKYLNLTEDFSQILKKKMDIIFFRNVFIYFNRETNISIIEKFYSILNDESYLFLGPSETLWKISDKFILRMFKNSFIYQKTKKTDAEFDIKEPQSDIPPPKTVRQVVLPKVIPQKRKAEKIKTSDIEGSLDEVENLINDAEYDKAETMINRILKSGKRDKDALILKLLIYCNKSDENGLFSYLDEINNIMPIFPEMYYILGNYYDSKGKVDLAIDAFKKVIFLDRKLIQSREKLLNLYLKKDSINNAKLEAKNLLIQLKSDEYKLFSSKLFPKLNIKKLIEHCEKIQSY